jgi:hypothetical protein
VVVVVVVIVVVMMMISFGFNNKRNFLENLST